MAATAIKATHKAVKAYYETLQEYAGQHVTHEGATETAFQRLLADTARTHGWMLVPKLTIKVGTKNVIPDGTVRDQFNLHRGYWEAKDSDDDLQVEIRKKIAKGYPLTNTIFEDTRQAVLFQNGDQRLTVDLSDRQGLADLLNEFYAYTQPNIAGFEQAVDEFKERVPELAQALAEKIKQAHSDNAGFQKAFDDFFTLCRTALNPNLRQEAVDEMLVQHLLTERLIRKIFDNPEFTQRNVIAAEVEKVITALTIKSFNRDEFLKSLDRFYRAIEEAAHSLDDFTEKQHFLNTVYERFFQGYSVKVADTHGIVYTPQPIVDFMCASVAEVLEKEFGKTLGDEGVNILDPCTGTGNFIVNLLRRMAKKDLPRMYREQMFANELMLLPYYIAALNIEHAYYELTGNYESFEGLCFVDTLDMAEGSQKQLSFMTEKNTQRVERQKKAPITVIIGNPPYNAWQLDENDNNKNRKYAVIDQRIRETYAKDSAATNKNALSDMYVKFFRWAVDRLQGSDGIVCFVSNNSFVDQIAFDGMRKHLAQDFTQVFHVHLEGNVRQNPTLAGTSYNVFGIQVGVGITVAVRSKQCDRGIRFFRVDKFLRREEKLALLTELGGLSRVDWRVLNPDRGNSWLVLKNSGEFSSFLSLGHREAKSSKNEIAETIFKTYGRGVATCRDDVVYGFNARELTARVRTFIENFNIEVDRYKRMPSKGSVDDFVNYQEIKWSRDLKLDLVRGNYAQYVDTKVRSGLYRPFTRRFLFFDRILNEEVYVFPHIFPDKKSEQENRIIWVKVGTEWPMFALAAGGIVDLLPQGGSQCFPYYVYEEDGSNRRENVTDWALEKFRTHYEDAKISKWDIFYYVYGVLHHPGYREKFADNLKRELPRVPLAPGTLTPALSHGEREKRAPSPQPSPAKQHYSTDS